MWWSILLVWAKHGHELHVVQRGFVLWQRGGVGANSTPRLLIEKGGVSARVFLLFRLALRQRA